jgi:hypothetical protein
MSIFKKFAADHAPAAVTVAWADVVSAASRLGLSLEREKFFGSRYRLSDGTGNWIGLEKGPVTLSYSWGFEGGKHEGAQALVYTAGWGGSQNVGTWSSNREPASHPAERMLAELRRHYAPQQTVLLPERVVLLPMPKEGVEWWGDYYSGGCDFPYMFVGEARDAFETNRMEVEKVFEEASS